MLKAKALGEIIQERGDAEEGQDGLQDTPAFRVCALEKKPALMTSL